MIDLLVVFSILAIVAGFVVITRRARRASRAADARPLSDGVAKPPRVRHINPKTGIPFS